MAEPANADAEVKVDVDGPQGEVAQAEAPEVKPAEEGAEEGADKPVEKKKKKKSCFKCKNPYLFFLALLMCSEWGDRS